MLPAPYSQKWCPKYLLYHNSTVVGCQLADEQDHFLIYQEIPVLKRIFRVDIACTELAPLFGN